MPIDPKDFEFMEHAHSVELANVSMRINILNVILCVYFILALLPVFHRIPIAVEFIILFFPFLSILVPFYIARSYPVLKYPAARFTRKTKIPLKLNTTGILILMLFINVIYASKFGWIHSLVCALVLIYILVMILSVRPVFSKEIRSPHKWTQDEMTWKVGLLILSVFLMKYLGLLFLKINNIHEPGNITTISSLLSISVLIPFYIGIAAARLPISDVNTTHAFSKVELKRFEE